MEQTTIQFGNAVQDLPKKIVFGAALETSGFISDDSVQHIQVDGLRRLYLLLVDSQSLDESVYSYRMNNAELLTIREQLYALLPDLERPYKNIGYQWGWMPQLACNGSFCIDDIQSVPIREILADENLPAKASIATCTLSKNTIIKLPPVQQALLPQTEVFIDGQSIRTCITVPEPPGSGTRIAA